MFCNRWLSIMYLTLKRGTASEAEESWVNKKVLLTSCSIFHMCFFFCTMPGLPWKGLLPGYKAALTWTRVPTVIFCSSKVKKGCSHITIVANLKIPRINQKHTPQTNVNVLVTIIYELELEIDWRNSKWMSMVKSACWLNYCFKNKWLESNVQSNSIGVPWSKGESQLKKTIC